jgi:hypothetical protein
MGLWGMMELFTSEPEFFNAMRSDGNISQKEELKIARYQVDRKYILPHVIDFGSSVIRLGDGYELRVTPVMNRDKVKQVKIEGVLQQMN